MADPRTATLEERLQKSKDVLSPLMRALTNNKEGDKINVCPFGCQEEDLDDNGYCRHLVGFTNDNPKDCAAGKGTYEPMVRRQGRRVVQVPRPRVPSGRTDEDGVQEFDEGPPQPPAVRKGDKLVQITTSYRVYRDVDTLESATAQGAEKAEKALTAPERVQKRTS